MSKHNYSQYSNNKKKPNYTKPQAVEEVESVTTTATTEVEPAEIKMEYETPIEHIYINETADVVETPKSTTGIVVGCNRLNVRVEPDSKADIAAVIIRDSDVEIDISKSNKDWFKITTAAGVEGYCMRNFIRTKV